VYFLVFKMKSGAGFLLFQQDLAPAPFTEYNTVFRLSNKM